MFLCGGVGDSCLGTGCLGKPPLPSPTSSGMTGNWATGCLYCRRVDTGCTSAISATSTISGSSVVASSGSDILNKSGASLVRKPNRMSFGAFPIVLCFTVLLRASDILAKTRGQSLNWTATTGSNVGRFRQFGSSFRTDYQSEGGHAVEYSRLHIIALNIALHRRETNFLSRSEITARGSPHPISTRHSSSK